MTNNCIKTFIKNTSNQQSNNLNVRAIFITLIKEHEKLELNSLHSITFNNDDKNHKD